MKNVKTILCMLLTLTAMVSAGCFLPFVYDGAADANSEADEEREVCVPESIKNEVEEKTGMSYNEYCELMSSLEDKIIYVYDDNGEATVQITKAIENGRTGAEFEGNGFTIYIDSNLLVAGESAIITAIGLAANPIVALVIGVAAPVALNYAHENYCPNGVWLHYNCYYELWGVKIYHYPYLESVGGQ